MKQVVWWDAYLDPPSLWCGVQLATFLLDTAHTLVTPPFALPRMENAYVMWNQLALLIAVMALMFTFRWTCELGVWLIHCRLGDTNLGKGIRPFFYTLSRSSSSSSLTTLIKFVTASDANKDEGNQKNNKITSFVTLMMMPMAMFFFSMQNVNREWNHHADDGSHYRDLFKYKLLFVIVHVFHPGHEHPFVQTVEHGWSRRHVSFPNDIRRSSYMDDNVTQEREKIWHHFFFPTTPNNIATSDDTTR